MQKFKKILVVFGTRPEAIKMAPVVKAFKRSNHFFTKVCITGQHRQMLDQVVKIFEIHPDYDLDIMVKGQDLYDITAKIIQGMKLVFDEYTPDLVLVHGDTTTSSMTALAAFYKKIPVAHVEAGLRTNNKYAPWPEEINRQITARIANIHFAPTENAKRNLINENIPNSSIFITGNTVIDALHLIIKKIESQEQLANSLDSYFKEHYKLETLRNKFILVTGHRRENFGQGFFNICNALKTIAKKNPNINIVYPVHLNPNVQKPVYEILGDTDNIYLLPPLDYLPFVYLLNKCFFALTDSGGIQEEAPGLGKPVLVMRETTERPEAVAAGTVELVGTNENAIVEKSLKLIIDKGFYNKMSKAHNPYGDGTACERILSILENL